MRCRYASESGYCLLPGQNHDAGSMHPPDGDGSGNDDAIDHQDPQGVTVREHFMGWNDAYDVFYRGEARFRSASTHYDVPVSGEWEGPKFVFQSKGIDRIDATNNGLKPTGDSLGPLQNRCGENFGKND